MTTTNRIKSLLPIISPTIAITSALFVGAILISIAGANPIAAYTALFQESLFDYFGFGNTLTKSSRRVSKTKVAGDKFGRVDGERRWVSITANFSRRILN